MSTQPNKIQQTNLPGLAVGDYSRSDAPAASNPTAITGPSSTTAPGAGGAGALPATPKGYLTVLVNGVSQKIAYY